MRSGIDYGHSHRSRAVFILAAVLNVVPLSSCLHFDELRRKDSLTTYIGQGILKCTAGIKISEEEKISLAFAIGEKYKSAGLEGAINHSHGVTPGPIAQSSKEYHACMDAWLAKFPDQKVRCGPRGCIDVKRVADFTGSGCDGTKKRDRVEFIDHITLLTEPDAQFYRARAQKEAGQKYALYDLAAPIPQELSPQEPLISGLQDLHWNVSINNRSIKTKWVIDNSQYPEPGISFSGAGYVIRNIDLEIKLPNGVRIMSQKVTSPSDKLDKCLSDGRMCRDLYTSEAVEVRWEWTMWNNCP